MKLNKLLFTAVAGFATLLVGCQEYDEDKHHYDNQLFISSSIFTKEIKFKAGDDKLQDGLSVAIAKPEAYDTHAYWNQHREVCHYLSQTQNE